MSADLLVIAGNASEILERHGFVACGRRQNGVTRVDFWTREGKKYGYVLADESVSIDDVVVACLEMAGHEAPAKRSVSHLS